MSEFDEQFKNPVAHVNFQTGEGYNRIQEIWEKEGCETIKEK